MSRGVRWALFALIAALLIGQQLLTVPGDTRFAEALHNSLHVPWFAVVTLILLRLFGWRVGVGVAVLLAFGSEAFQWLTDRQPSLADVGRDGLGALLALAVILWSQNRRRAGAALLLVVVCVTVLPLVQALLSKAQMREVFPVLLSPDVKASVYFLKTDSQLDPAPEGVRVRLSERRWPGVHISEPVSDWQGYNALHVELVVGPGGEMPVFVSVRQAETGGATGYSRFRLQPGTHELQVPLDTLLTRGRVPVEDVFIYSRGRFAGREITLKRVFLSR